MTFTADFALKPYWLEAIPAAPAAGNGPPAKCDVVVIGAGVTGVEASRVLAEGGRVVVVVDAGAPGEGASSRNAGMIGRNFKHSYSGLKAAYGVDIAKGFFAEMQQAYDAVRDLGRANPEAFGWRENGRVIGAMSPALLDSLRREYELRARDLGETVEVLGRREMHDEMQSHLYAGGIRLPFNGTIQPAQYHLFLANRARSAGARIFGNTRVLGVDRQPTGFTVVTGRGSISCKQILVATNGYSDRALPAFKRRLLPINAYMVATEVLPQNLLRATLPGSRTYHDNRRRSHFLVVPPNENRILIGGRTGNLGIDLKALAAKLHGDLMHIFPELAGTRISHAWTGRCAAPIDAFPRFGALDGIHYALGYSFSGMAMGPHLARKVAASMMNRAADATSYFARPDFPTVPLPARTPLTMPMVIGYYGWADRPSSLGRRM